MADLSAGALTVSIDSDLTKLEQGLSKAEQKVGETTQDLDKMSRSAEKTGEKTGGSFKGAAMQVEQFQAKLGKVLGVLGGLAAGIAILDGIGNSLIAARRNTGALSDEFGKFERDYVEFTKDIPLLGQLTGFVDRLGIAFGLLDDPVREATLEVYALEKAIENLATIRSVKQTTEDFQAMAFQIEKSASELEMFGMGFDPLQRQAEEALLGVEEQIRGIEKQIDQFRGADGGLFFTDDEEGRKQEQIYDDLVKTLKALKAEQKDLQIAANDVLDVRRTELETIEKQNRELAKQDLSELKSTLQDLANLRFDETGLDSLKPYEALAKQITDQFEASLKEARELAETLDETEALRLLDSLKKVEEQFKSIDVKQKAIEVLGSKQREEFQAITDELKKQADAAELDLRIQKNKDTALGDQLEKQRDVIKVQEEFAKKREELEKQFREGRLEGIELSEKSEKVLADALAELDRAERARVATVLATEKKVTKEKKKQLDLSKLVEKFDTGLGAFEVFIPPDPLRAAAANPPTGPQALPADLTDLIPKAAPLDLSALEGLNLEPPMIDLAALTGTISTAENRVGSILENMLQQDQTRNSLLQEVIRSVKQISTVGTSGAFT